MTNDNDLRADFGALLEIDPAAVPLRWGICPACRGFGSGAGEPDARALEDDPDYAADYFAGTYDRACPDCVGSGKVRELDRDRLTADQQRTVDDHFEALREHAAEVAAGA